MKKIFLMVFLFFVIMCSSRIRAQYVTIPDPNMVFLLQNLYPGCMSGSQLDTTCTAITNEVILDIDQLWGVSNADGIQYFDNLETLNVELNGGVPLPAHLPGGLTMFSVSGNNLTSIPALPPGLLFLGCYSPLVTSFPALPSGLLKIHASGCQLTSLPALPITLIELECNSDSLTSLPPLPPNLLYLSCGSSLTSLPALPSSLEILYCQGNSLTSLPTLPASLKWLYCDQNLLTSLPALPNGLEVLGCQYNMLTHLPALPDSLNVLGCSYNNIDTMPLLPSGLEDLYCYHNNLVHFANVNEGLHTLDCTGNVNLTCLPNVPLSLWSLLFDTTAIQCLPNYPSPGTASNSNLYAFPLCSPGYNPDGCPLVQAVFGEVYYDSDLSCDKGIIENNIASIPVHLFQSGILVQQAFSGSYGYATTAAAIGNYDVVVDTAGLPFTASCVHPGVDTNIVISSPGSMIEDVDFGLTCKPGYDIGIFSAVKTSGMFFPTLEALVYVRAGDASFQFFNQPCNTVGVGGTVQVVINGPASYVSPAPGSLIPSVAGNVLTYTISDFSTVNINTDFGIICVTDTFAMMGEHVCFDITTTTSGSDYDLSNNHLNYCFLVTNSYDPNVKEVNPLGNVGYPFTDWVTYTIHFQNTGSAPALNIVIQDSLDADFDLSSFRLLTSSHPVSVNINNNLAAFHFFNINLPDSNSNEPLSHGYVQYKIKPDGVLPTGTTFNNRGDIYFDFNTPVLTNTTSTTINLIGIENETDLSLIVYPNPASEYFVCTIPENETGATFVLTDLLGNVVKTGMFMQANTTISTQDLSNGIYVLGLHSNGRSGYQKIIVSK